MLVLLKQQKTIRKKVEKVKILDNKGYILTHEGSSETDVEGVFAAGDVKDPKYKQAVISAGSGAMAAMDAVEFLDKD